VDILEGPISDARDCLSWIYSGGLDDELSSNDATKNFRVDMNNVCAFGTSSGGALALSLGYGVKRPVKAVLDFYGAINYRDPFWTSSIDAMNAPAVSEEFINQVYQEKPIPTQGGVSLEGQARSDKPPPLGPRPAFAFTHIANGTLMDVCFPSKDWQAVDPVLNVDKKFSPTCIVHGQEDKMVPMYLSRVLYDKLGEAGVDREWIEVPGEGHTFAGKMEKGGKTWEVQRKGFDWLEKQIER